MKALRIILKQNIANYRKEESVDNKMTYPLPPMSTVIGALYSACGYTRQMHPEEIDIKVGIQGKYGSMQRKVYTDHAFLNSVMNDRGILVKLKNKKLMSNAYEVVAKAKASKDNDFEKEITIDVVNRELLNEYQNLREQRRCLDIEKKEKVDPQVKEYSSRIKLLKAQLKQLAGNKEEVSRIKEEIENITMKKVAIQDEFSERRNAADEQYDLFASLTTSLKSYEVLYDVELVIHVLSDDKTMEDIMNHVYDIKSIGRSEDYVDVQSVEYVELLDYVDEEKDSQMSAYLPYEAVRNEDLLVTTKGGIKAQGTKYYMNKIYHIEDNKRVFNKKWVLYTSNYSVDSDSQMGSGTGVFYDGDYIVALI